MVECATCLAEATSHFVFVEISNDDSQYRRAGHDRFSGTFDDDGNVEFLLLFTVKWGDWLYRICW